MPPPTLVAGGIMYLSCSCASLLTYCLEKNWTYFTRLSALVLFRQGWTIQVLGSEGQSSRTGWVLHTGKCTLWPCYYDILKITDWISPKFQRRCILGQGWTLQCLRSKVKVKITTWPRAQRAEAYRARRCAASSNFYLRCVRTQRVDYRLN